MSVFVDGTDVSEGLAGDCQSGNVSVNVNLTLRVDGLRSSHTAYAVGQAMERLFADEGMSDDVRLDEEPAGAMVWTTPWPLVISGLPRWRGRFENAVRSAVAAVAPELLVTIEWDYPDEA
jgi:hypothetical protein